MLEPNKVIDSLLLDRELVLQFFALFSRFEYALKRSRFLKVGDKAEADWDKYGNSLRGLFGVVKDPVFHDAIECLLKKPPDTQVVLGNNLDWKGTLRGDGEHDERYILRLVCTVRNNLFHGGKYPPPFGPVDDVARNRQLLQAGIAVLSHCLDLSEDVRTKFEETA